jgi:hypothetical protein
MEWLLYLGKRCFGGREERERERGYGLGVPELKRSRQIAFRVFVFGVGSTEI